METKERAIVKVIDLETGRVLMEREASAIAVTAVDAENTENAIFAKCDEKRALNLLVGLLKNFAEAKANLLK